MKYSSYTTIEDIAKRMKVSAVTVSKALKGHPDISVETSKRVKKLAHELGYIPNYFFKNISSNQSKVIGIIVPNITQFFFTPVIETMYQIAYEMGYEIILKISQGNVNYEKKLIESLLSMRVDGIIISVTKETKDLSIFRQVKKLGVALTLINDVVDNNEFNKVTIDCFERAFKATAYAISSGYYKFVYISEHNDDFNGVEGFKSALIQNGIAVDENMVLDCSSESKSGYDCFIKLYESKNIPECIFCSNYPILIGILKAANVVGMKIPGDIELITSGYQSIEQLAVQPLVYIEQPTLEYSRKAFELTIRNIIEKDKCMPQAIKLTSDLVFRNEMFNSEKNSAMNHYFFQNVGVYF